MLERSKQFNLAIAPATQGHGFDSQWMHELYNLNAMQVTLDQSIWQMHKCKAQIY